MNYSKLSRKQLLKDAFGVSSDWLQLNSDSPSTTRVTALRDTVTDLLQEKSRLDDQQNALTSAVGRAKRAGESTDDLIVQMRTSATRLKKLKLSINETADRLLEIFQEQINPEVEEIFLPSAPGQFLAQHWKASEKTIEETDLKFRSTQKEKTDKNTYSQSVPVPADKDHWHVSETLSAEQWDAYVASHP